MKNINWSLFPIQELSLHSKLQNMVQDGILTQSTRYIHGFGYATSTFYQGYPVKIKYGVNRPNFKISIPSSDNYNDLQDVAYVKELDMLITWAKAI